jgi:hypothetical protein
MSLSDGAPYLMTRTVGRGRVALFTSTIDRDWGDLPIRPHFLPLVQEVVRYLTRVSNMESPPGMVGHSLPIPVGDPRIRRVRIIGPNGDLWVSERPPSAEQAWRFEETDVSGHYRMEADPPLPDMKTMPGFAIAVDAHGSDLRSRSVVAGKGAEAQQMSKAAFTPQQRNELWHGALLCLFVILLGEALLLWSGRNAMGTPPRPEKGGESEPARIL